MVATEGIRETGLKAANELANSDLRAAMLAVREEGSHKPANVRSAPPHTPPPLSPPAPTSPRMCSLPPHILLLLLLPLLPLLLLPSTTSSSCSSTAAAVASSSLLPASTFLAAQPCPMLSRPCSLFPPSPRPWSSPPLPLRLYFARARLGLRGVGFEPSSAPLKRSTPKSQPQIPNP